MSDKIKTTAKHFSLSRIVVTEKQNDASEERVR